MAYGTIGITTKRLPVIGFDEIGYTSHINADVQLIANPITFNTHDSFSSIGINRVRRRLSSGTSNLTMRGLDQATNTVSTHLGTAAISVIQHHSQSIFRLDF